MSAEETVFLSESPQHSSPPVLNDVREYVNHRKRKACHAYVADQDGEAELRDGDESREDTSETTPARRDSASVEVVSPPPDQTPPKKLRIDTDAVDVAVSDDDDARVWTISRMTTRNTCHPNSVFGISIGNHDPEMGPFVCDFDEKSLAMFVRYQREWAVKPPKDIDSYTMQEWIRLWINAERVGSAGTATLALKQIYRLVGDRLKKNKHEAFIRQIHFLWSERPEACQLREFFLDVYRCAGLGQKKRVKLHCEQFKIDLIDNLTREEKGGQGVAGLKQIQLRDYPILLKLMET